MPSSRTKSRRLSRMLLGGTFTLRSSNHDSDTIVSSALKGVTSSAGTETYATLNDLPGSANTGSQAFVTGNNSLYIYNGTGWYKVALVNNTPYWITTPNDTYEFDLNNIDSDFVITVEAGDSDATGPILEYTAVGDSDFNLMADITKDSDNGRIFNIGLTEGFDSETSRNSTVTFKASDGISFASKVVNFNFQVFDGFFTRDIITNLGWGGTPTTNNGYTYNSSTLVWTNGSGDSNTYFDVLNIRMDISDTKYDKDEWWMEFAAYNMPTTFNGRSYLILSAKNSTTDGTSLNSNSNAYYAQMRSDTGAWENGSSITGKVGRNGSFSQYRAALNWVKSSGTMNYWWSVNDGSSWTKGYSHTAFGANNAIDLVEVRMVQRTGTGLNVQPINASVRS